MSPRPVSGTALQVASPTCCWRATWRKCGARSSGAEIGLRATRRRVGSFGPESMSDVRNNGSNMIIRHYEPSDLAQILALYAQQDVFADTLQLPHHPIDHWRRKIEQTEGYSCLVAPCTGTRCSGRWAGRWRVFSRRCVSRESRTLPVEVAGHDRHRTLKASIVAPGSANERHARGLSSGASQARMLEFRMGCRAQTDKEWRGTTTNDDNYFLVFIIYVQVTI